MASPNGVGKCAFDFQLVERDENVTPKSSQQHQKTHQNLVEIQFIYSLSYDPDVNGPIIWVS